MKAPFVILSALLSVSIFYNVLFYNEYTKNKNTTANLPVLVEKNKDHYYISVNSVRVANVPPYGYLGKGSTFFDWGKAEDGYQINVKLGDSIIGTSYCNKLGLKQMTDQIAFELSVKDSVVKTIPIK